MIATILFPSLTPPYPHNAVKTRILVAPEATVGIMDESAIEHPLPQGIAKEIPCIIITAISPVTNQRIPALLLTVKDAAKLIHGIEVVKKKMHFRGPKAVEVEEQFDPKRVVHY